MPSFTGVRRREPGAGGQEHGDPANRNDDCWALIAGRNEFLSDATYPAWDRSCSCVNFNNGYGEASAGLTSGTYTQAVDLSSIDVGDEFYVSFVVFAAAWEFVLGNTAAEAFLQDPISLDGGVGFEIEGLTPTNRARLVLPPVPEPSTCASMLGGLGLLALSARRKPARRAG